MFFTKEGIFYQLFSIVNVKNGWNHKRLLFRIILFYPTGFVEWKYSYDCDCRFDYYNQMKGEKNT